MPDAGSVLPPVWPGLAWDAVAAVTARAVRARPVIHLTADDRGFGHRVLRPVAAARGGDTGKDTRAGLPRKAPRSPRAASRADGRRQATRPAPRASRATRGAFAGVARLLLLPNANRIPPVGSSRQSGLPRFR